LKKPDTQLKIPLFASSRKVPTSLVQPLVSVFELVRPECDARVRELAEIIAELRDPLMAEDGPAEPPASLQGTPMPPKGM